MTDQTTPEALTDEDLAAMRAGYAMARGMDARHLRQDTRDAIRLLDEVDRLRARNSDLFRRLGEHMDDLGDAHTENTKLAAALTEAEAEQESDPVVLDLRAQLAETRAENTRLHTWDGLMSLLDEHWPETILPTLPDETARDAGSRIVSLIRWVEMLHTEQKQLRARHGSTPLTLAQAATALHGWAGDLADGARTDWPAGHPDIIRGIRAAADWLDARDKYETETREQLRALVNRHGMADRTCLISDNTTE